MSDNLGIAEAAFIGELQGLRSGQPRRHEARLGDRNDLAPVLADVLVGEQRKRAGLARTMAGGAISIDDGRDIAIERDTACTPGTGGVHMFPAR